ncbi:MAG: aldehyde ferredoxin oxidoreductase family protein [Actinobacteria bacterium]|nr:aldehyde ferredoxin oxidoreductase family protein [Actinomycetota bacterium]MCG2818671.1 aldehyde ferredoxin oxidoreductase family protein [Actinomycetes bacterium]MBU4178973.1 aldehyde ferredoxin oxidoreductase family protein [Actinomycetota bacterium]MBU4218139.1 aldehyde ferredoxin oxidoreductase family protein [Actinomycetota bacterium]MBU4358564.1 aldehyde ferredoxin oxidoreductase family protein [Actinomycetota bacterium]
MSTKYSGYLGRFLDIDLSTGKVGEYDVTDEMLEAYLGSKGLASKILYDTLSKGVNPLGEENVFIVNTGPLVNSGAPCTSRFNVTTKSPLTGGILSCNCGGNFGMFLKRAGFDGLILRGKASKPTWIHIEDGEVELKDAKDLWGLTTEEAQEKLPKGTGKMVIGPAGENAVLYACIISQERALGRGGAGAVMGSKNIKAITAKGNHKVPKANPEKFKKDVRKWVEILKEHPSTGEMMPEYGTAVFINRCNAANTLPTHNFKRGSFAEADAVSGETLAETRLTGNFGCASCVIKCGRRVEVDGKNVKGPEYETLGLLGPNLENPDLGLICDWNYQADLVGVDTVSLGNVLGFAMELNENGLWDNGLEFGKVDNISGVIDDIANRRGIGDDLADGVKRLSEKYGGKDYAMEVKGLELPAYEPRGAVGHGLGYAIANRGGCHIGGGYMVYFEANGPLTMDPLTTRAKPQLTAMLQTMLDALSDSGSCQFTGFTTIPKQAIELNPHGNVYRVVAKSLELMGPMMELILRFPKMLAFVPPMALMQHPRVITDLTGMKMTFGKFLEIGLRTYMIERLFNAREGFTGADDTLPRRSTHQVQEGGTDTTVPLNQMIRIYYRVRGLDANGAPKHDTLRRLGMRA